MLRVEVDGSPLSMRSPAYGVGEAFFQARDDRVTAVDRRYAFHSIGAVVDGEFDYARGRSVSRRGGARSSSGLEPRTSGSGSTAPNEFIAR